MVDQLMGSAKAVDAGALARTPLHDLHVSLEAKLVPFAGYEMPVQYPTGILAEHHHTREQAGLFDVSHMGQVRLVGAHAAAALESLVPVDIIDLPAGSQRYALFTNDKGGVLDDLMVINAGDHLFLVVNAACKHQDIEHLTHHLSAQCEVVPLTDRALLALQGPHAGEVLENLCPEVAALVFMQARAVSLLGHECYVSRSGYTGEDGFEISIPASAGTEVAEALLADERVKPIGLGARDSLRLEAGLCLYGHELDTDTTPVEANLKWALSKSRRADGARPGGFPGASIIHAQLAQGTQRRRVGLAVDDRAPVREGADLMDPDGKPVGRVTSGGFAPSLGAPVAMGMVDVDMAAKGTELNALVRGKPRSVSVCVLPFVAHRYRRA